MHEMPIPSEIERLRSAAGSVAAPPALRARVAQQIAHAQTRRERRRRRWTLGGGLVAAAAAAAAALAIVLPGGGSPTVAQVAGLGTAAATQAAPPMHPSHRGWLDVAVDGVWFPDYGTQSRWQATGLRTDTVDGRRAVTVFYRGNGGTRLGYTIVSGGALDWPGGARSLRRGPTEFRTFATGDRRIVTWREHGHQCVISAPRAVPEGQLITLASWADQENTEHRATAYEPT